MLTFRSVFCAMLACLGLSACNSATTTPVTRSSVSLSPPSGPSELHNHYARIQQDYLKYGFLRTDQGRSVSYDRLDLVNDFSAIALSSEYDQSSGGLSGTSKQTPLKRWVVPVAIQLSFGAHVPAAQQNKDSKWVAAYTQKLARASRHPVRKVPAKGNFHVLIMTEAERKAAGPLIKGLAPGISKASLRHLTRIPRSQLCLVVAFDGKNGSKGYSNAIAMIPAELPDLLRHSCIQEEIAQGLGLPNDSPRARPSLFNDDKEFAYLTQHDEYLLRILYDPQLKIGMTVDQVRPIADRIAWDMSSR
ncbi:MAG: DUF2927 domain-containing protein [Pseudoruegeria sp.]